ncbi:MAG: type I-MYXAN CRISPR-associated protein Cmx8 [Candidatus Sericytochromatia bacterium]
MPATLQDTVTLDYSLYDLPSAQHKAGLAGLILLIQTLEKQGISPLPQIEELTPVSAKIRVSELSLRTVFNEVYAACYIESAQKQIRKDKEVIEPVRIEERIDTKSGKTEKFHIYHDPRPKGSVLSLYLSGGEQSPWLKLWQDMVWGTLRGIPATRKIYEEQLEGVPSSESSKVWKALLKSQIPKYKELTAPVASSVCIGAQEINAEKILFQGSISENILLHFWNLTLLVYVPQRFKPDGERLKTEDAGFAIVIPEVADLEEFLENYVPIIQNLSPEKLGYRPKEARISVPEEAGMEYLYHLTEHYFLEKQGKKLKRNVNAVEVYHLEKKGNNIRMLSSAKIIPQEKWLSDYEKLRKLLFNPLFKSVCLKNLLKGMPWYTGMQDIFSTHTWHLFCSAAQANRFDYFGRDAHRRFQALIQDLDPKEEMGMDPSELQEDTLARSIYRLIRSYVQLKTEHKSGMKYQDFKEGVKQTGYPKSYREAREKICSDAFLAMRGRREVDFIEYFTGTICSVPHYLPEEDFIKVSHALIRDWETVKTLSMLALSAHSYLGNPKQNHEPQGDEA